MNTIDVSVVIVCMNNYEQLKDCLDSIRQYTHQVSYEVLLVAYFFSEDNLEKLKAEYPWVKVIISNEIRGFSANNNLALRQAQGRYCFVLNDDTYMTMPVIDLLVERMNNNKNIALLSPQIIRPNGNIQYTGIPPISWIDRLKIFFKLKKEAAEDGKYVRREGFFRTYNILGAAFMIRTDIFREMGFFDERYFFGPEDIALSTLLNRKGYECWVDTDVKIVHLGGQTGGTQSRTICAARPANRKGCLINCSEDKWYRYVVMASLIWVDSALLTLYWGTKALMGGEKSCVYSLKSNINVCKSIFSRLSSTEIFKKYYKQRFPSA